MENYLPTLSQRLNELKKEGYTEDLNLQSDCLYCSNGNFKLYAKDFQIDKYYRFEGPSDPADEAVLYAISSEKHNIKGVLVNGYGIYSDAVSNEMLQKLKMTS